MHSTSPRVVLLPCLPGRRWDDTLEQKHSRTSFREAKLFAASFWHFPVPSCSHTCACWLQEPLTQQEWCASTFSSWILLIHERFSLSALTGWCQANRNSSSAPRLLMKTRPFLQRYVMLCFIQITLKFSVTRLLQFIIPWNSIMNPLVVTSTWLSHMQMPYSGEQPGTESALCWALQGVCWDCLFLFCVSLSQKEPALQEINSASIFRYRYRYSVSYWFSWLCQHKFQPEKLLKQEDKF